MVRWTLWYKRAGPPHLVRRRHAVQSTIKRGPGGEVAQAEMPHPTGVYRLFGPSHPAGRSLTTRDETFFFISFIFSLFFLFLFSPPVFCRSQFRTLLNDGMGAIRLSVHLEYLGLIDTRGGSSGNSSPPASSTTCWWLWHLPVG
ncbi:hypothetical protein LZ32DRAFT_139294 [Colletotrichum eremochloae]|nr:hypothetical protein LZ32DRAFT_139294 [Colletotrichum eremochloae]